LVGAVYGTLLVSFGKTYFSETFPAAWLFLMAALFIGVTMAFPNGLAGLVDSHLKPWWRAWRLRAKKVPASLPPSSPSPTPTAAATQADALLRDGKLT
jgi:urea transport system permease protein